jgi:hypothetical protein
MLEENIGSSNYSMVEFGNFENYAINSSGTVIKTPSDFWTGSGTTYSIISDEALFGKVLSFSGSLSSKRYVKQTVYKAPSEQIIYYDTNEPFDDRARTFIVSGFGKGSYQVENPTSKFAIRVDIKYYKGVGNPDQVETIYLDFQNVVLIGNLYRKVLLPQITS